jgi:hypothetical protein
MDEAGDVGRSSEPWLEEDLTICFNYSLWSATPPAASPFAAWCVIRLKVRSCSPSPFGPWFAHRRRVDTNSSVQCF